MIHIDLPAEKKPQASSYLRVIPAGMKANDTGTADKAVGFSTTVSERRKSMKRLIIAFITWLLAGVMVTAAWAAGPAKPVIEGGNAGLLYVYRR